jgi:hypothetical protein
MRQVYFEGSWKIGIYRLYRMRLGKRDYAERILDFSRVDCGVYANDAGE